MRISYWHPSQESHLGPGYLVRGRILGELERPVLQPDAADGTEPVVLPDPGAVILPLVADAEGLQEPGSSLAWMPASRGRFTAWCDRVERWAAAMGAEPVIWPVATGVISDVPSVMTFLRARPRWRLLFDPVGLLTHSMLPRAEEHVTRLFQALGQHPALIATVLSGAEAGSDAIEPRSLAAGDPLSQLLLRIHATAGRGDIVLRAGDEARQENLLREHLRPAGTHS